jgi:hypothetical protein
MQTKSIDPAALAGLTTGFVLTNFADMHEAAEHVMGAPIWTHQFPVVLEELKAAILAQFPDMPTELLPEGWQATRDAVWTRYGKAVEVRQGSSAGIHPLDPAGFPSGFAEKLIVVAAG